MEPNTVMQIDDAELIYRNFSGTAGDYNVEGNRNFGVFVTPEQAVALKADGWNVRETKPTEEGEPVGYFITVKVNYGGRRPPRIYLVYSDGRSPVEMDIEDLERLDHANIQHAAVSIRPWVWQEKPQRVKGYLQEAYIELVPDRLRDKYLTRVNLPEDGEPN